MEAHSVDPRDQTWEIVSRVTASTSTTARVAATSMKSVGAGILEVATWVDAHTLERTYVLYVCVPGDGLGLIRLAGTDRNEEGGVTWDFAVPDR